MSWGTGEELRFLRGIGTYNARDGSNEFRLKLLHGYRQAMQHRTDWGLIDKDAVRVYVDTEIERLTNIHKPSKGGVK